MSDKILVRTAGGDVLNVTAMRLSWARDHEELLGLMDWYSFDGWSNYNGYWTSGRTVSPAAIG